MTKYTWAGVHKLRNPGIIAILYIVDGYFYRPKPSVDCVDCILPRLVER